MNTRPRVVFFGTPKFSVPILNAAAQISDVVVVVTQPDAPTGRGQLLQPSPIKQHAMSMGVRVLEPTRMRDQAFLDELISLTPDVAVLAAYGKILPEALLAIPTHGFLNVHPSLLPRYRGSSPIAGALLSGDVETGVSLIQLDQEMDHGPIVAQEKISLDGTEHRPEIELRLAELGGALLTSSLLPYLKGSLQPVEQVHAQATYTKLLSQSDAKLDWTVSATTIDRRVRAFDPWPGTKTHFQNQPLKILAGHAIDQDISGQAGSVVDHSGWPTVICGQGAYVLEKIQIAGGRPTDAVDFSRGHRNFIGSRLA